MSLDALPKSVRTPVAIVLGLLAVAVAGVGFNIWVDSRAYAAVEAKVQPVAKSVASLCEDVKAIRADSAATREDVAFLRGKLEK